ncbi:2-amino-4-hydroxy-6-hydroxymethyldihydropteridine diphosphokinase [Campylobacter sp. RM12637]|uniref:2-amino-4-hydroxy-6- hydroxymethyldihydropteridine diphosphokinase n=1 Tax=Campylobacter sp. RM12637 TaxID=2735734 RepID=UPI0030142750|nr:2-amino-4-hydroxy-6-hydroxymethyldihydropteridine diphosphokinase [Campylobacter sp. RM12637]
MPNIKINEARYFKRIKYYPYFSKDNKVYKYLALISLGSNIEPECERFVRLFKKLKSDRRFKIIQTSALLINEAFGYKEQKDFTNALMFVKTSLHARELLKVLQHYENIFHRTRSFKNAPRTLDLDIVYFSEKTYCDKRLVLPHYGAEDRISITLVLGTM